MQPSKSLTGHGFWGEDPQVKAGSSFLSGTQYTETPTALYALRPTLYARLCGAAALAGGSSSPVSYVARAPSPAALHPPKPCGAGALARGSSSSRKAYSVEPKALACYHDSTAVMIQDAIHRIAMHRETLSRAEAHAVMEQI